MRARACVGSATGCARKPHSCVQELRRRVATGADAQAHRCTLGRQRCSPPEGKGNSFPLNLWVARLVQARAAFPHPHIVGGEQPLKRRHPVHLAAPLPQPTILFLNGLPLQELGAASPPRVHACLRLACIATSGCVVSGGANVLQVLCHLAHPPRPCAPRALFHEEANPSASQKS